MLAYPAIDIRDGNCVRLIQGDFSKETVFSIKPEEAAEKWEREGASWIHVVDLDAAKKGSPQNKETIFKIRESVKANIQVGGGIRDLKTADMYLSKGINRVIFGSAAVENLPMIKDAVKFFGQDKVAVGVDTIDNKVATRGWTKTSSIELDELLKELYQIGIKHIIYTDISKDGMMQGPDFEGLEKALSFEKFSIIASGGVSSLEDIKKLLTYDISGAIIGKALYNGALDLKQVIATMNSCKNEDIQS